MCADIPLTERIGVFPFTIASRVFVSGSANSGLGEDIDETVLSTKETGSSAISEGTDNTAIPSAFTADRKSVV